MPVVTLKGGSPSPTGSISTIYNARPSSAVRRVNQQRDGVQCVAVGRLHEQKGFDLLVHALAEIPDVTARLVGDGVERATLEGLATETGRGGSGSNS